jgi:hypothetical protein
MPRFQQPARQKDTAWWIAFMTVNTSLFVNNTILCQSLYALLGWQFKSAKTS